MEPLLLELLVGLISLTLLLNLISLLFPGLTQRIQNRLFPAFKVKTTESSEMIGSFRQSVHPFQMIVVGTLLLAVSLNIGTLLFS